MQPGNIAPTQLDSSTNPMSWARLLGNVLIPIIFMIVVIVFFFRLDLPYMPYLIAIASLITLILVLYLVWNIIPERATIGPEGIAIDHAFVHKKAAWSEVTYIKAARVLTSSGKRIRTRPALKIKTTGWSYTLSSAMHPEEDLRKAFFKSVVWARPANRQVVVEDEYGWLAGGF